MLHPGNAATDDNSSNAVRLRIPVMTFPAKIQVQQAPM
jgi:hypothetical protein